VIRNQRPGVYSRYDAASSYTAPMSLRYAAVVAKATGGETDRLYSFASLAEALEIFPYSADETYVMSDLIGLLFESGVSRVLAVAVGNGYETALETLSAAENVGAVICDAHEQEDLTKLRSYVLKSFEERRECIAFCGIGDAAAAAAAAEALNCERMVIASPNVSLRRNGRRSAVFATAALAGRILATGDAAYNFNGEAFTQLNEPEILQENIIQQLLESGVTVFESVGGEVECIRALTTRTKTNGVPERSLSGINTVLIIDDIMQFVRQTLRIQLRGGRVSGSPLESIRSQVVVALSQKQQEGLIESFAPPRCRADLTDPGVCIVEMSFTVAHVISQIHVTAHIQV